MAETVFERDELDLKANDVFSGKVVRKDLVRKVKVGANVPVLSWSIYWVSIVRLQTRWLSIWDCR